MIYVTIIGHGPQWIGGRSVYDQDRELVQAHLESMRRRFHEGSLLLGGPFDRAGGIAVWEADDLDHARQLIDADPAVAADLMDYELYELTAFFNRFSGAEASGAVHDLRPSVATTSASS